MKKNLFRNLLLLAALALPMAAFPPPPDCNPCAVTAPAANFPPPPDCNPCAVSATAAIPTLVP